MHRIWTDSEIRRFLWDDEVISPAQAEATLRAILDSFAAERFGVWAIKIKGSHEIVGFCRLPRTESPVPRAQRIGPRTRRFASFFRMYVNSTDSVAERDGFELAVPIIEQPDDS